MVGACAITAMIQMLLPAEHAALGDLTIINIVFSECKAKRTGGGLSTFAVRAINLTNMTVRNATASGFGSTGFGGCVSVESSKIAISNSAFSECKANTNGGGLFLLDIHLATGSGGCVCGKLVKTMGVVGTSLFECAAAVRGACLFLDGIPSTDDARIFSRFRMRKCVFPQSSAPKKGTRYLIASQNFSVNETPELNETFFRR